MKNSKGPILEYTQMKPGKEDETLCGLLGGAILFGLMPIGFTMLLIPDVASAVIHLPDWLILVCWDALPLCALIFGGIGISKNIQRRLHENYPVARIIGDFVFWRMDHMALGSVLGGALCILGMWYAHHLFQ
jgi:hypothetical protein